MLKDPQSRKSQLATNAATVEVADPINDDRANDDPANDTVEMLDGEGPLPADGNHRPAPSAHRAHLD